MGQELSNCLTVLLKAKENGLYEKLISQLNKDLVLANIHSAILLEITANDLYLFLKEKIYRLIMEDFNDYLNFLYIVDVPEKSFKEITVTDAVAVAEQVTFLVLDRELQKVVLKNRYKNNS
jgi:hypothetical protein